jgi:YVTN family beta-propeller protein
VDCLAANTDVVVDDVSWFNAGPYDGTSLVSANTSAQLNQPTNRVRAYVTAVGNQAVSHYQESYTACGSSSLQAFRATTNTQDLAALGPLCGNPLLVPAGAIANAHLQWNDTWGASCNDYDLYLFTVDGSTLLASGTDLQTCSQDPTEHLAWQNTSSSDTAVVLVIDNYHGLAAPRTLSLFTTGAFPNFLTPGSSVPNQADAAGGVLSVGAIGASNPGNSLIEDYSGRGPTKDGRTKPDITGIDCVSVTGAGGFHVPFCGTSAAAPHIAGIAALLLQCDPALKAGEPGDAPSSDRVTLRKALVNFADDLGTPGADNTYGWGRANALASANSICQQVTPTPTVAPTQTGTPGPTTTPTCGDGIASPIYVAVADSPLSEVRIDASCTHVYASNPARNEIEVYSIQTRTLGSPIAVGSGPRGFDITSDGTKMYVANSAANSISVVDLGTNTELHKINLPPATDRPLSIAIAGNGKALFSTTFDGSGFGARMMQLDLATESVSQRTDFYINGTTTEATYLRASADRSKIGVVVGDISSGPVFTYTSGTDQFSPQVDGGACGYRGYIASDLSGSTYLVGGCPGTFVLDANLNVLGTVPLDTTRSFGVAMKPGGGIGYRAVETGIEILDLTHFVSLGTFSIPDTLGTPHPATYPARMAISNDGSLLAVNTDHGFALVAASASPPPAPTATVSPTPSATPPRTTGDVSCDGTANAIDAALILQFSAGLLSSLRCPQNGDVNHNGSINAIDAALILQFTAGLLPHL